MKRTAGISVIIPTYNRAKYIGESIDSVLAQTRQPDEILVIDDGSTDNTGDVVSAFRDSRIRFIAVPHGGIAAARNRGLSLASCDHLAFLDSDDLWRPTMLERQLDMLAQDETLVCSFTNFVRFRNDPYEAYPAQFRYYAELSELKKSLPERNGGYIVAEDPFATFVRFRELPAYMQCTMFRRSFIANMRMNESLRIGEDTEFILRTFMLGKVAFLAEPLADIRWHESNITKEAGSLIELDKMRALLCLRSAVDGGYRRAVLNDRIVRAHLDCAAALIGAGRRLEGIKAFRHALSTPGSPKRKIKGLARTTLNLIASTPIRAPRRQPPRLLQRKTRC